MKKLYEKYKEIILYIFFGVLTTAVNYGVYYLMAHPLGISIVASNIVAWAAGVIFAFYTNKLYVFESKSTQLAVVLKELTAFTACRAFSGILDTGIMYLFAQRLGYNDMIVKIASNIVVIIVNYVFSKMLIFRNKPQKDNPQG